MDVLYKKYTHQLFYSPTEAAFHRTVYEFKKQGIEQQKEDGLEELTTANFPSHDPNKPIGMSSVTSNLSHVRSSLSTFSIPFSTLYTTITSLLTLLCSNVTKFNPHRS